MGDEGTTRTVRTDAWPSLAHVCINGVNHDLRFDGPTPVGGAVKRCGRCNTEFVYVRRAAARRDAQEQGGRTHF